MTTVMADLHAGEALTAREVEVLQAASDGEAYDEIAARLYVSKETIKSHRRLINGKLEARNGTHAVAIGIRRGLIR